MAKDNEDLSKQLAERGAAVKPSSVAGTMKSWFYGDDTRPGKFQNIAELCGSEEEAKRLFVVSMVYITNRTDLMQADPRSLQACVMQSAVLGLLPGAMNECDFLTFKNIAKFCPGYQGLVKLAVQGETVTDISAQVVYEKDQFDYEEGTAPRIFFKKFLGPQEARGNRICAYAVARLQNGQHKFEIITPDQWESVKARSMGANSSFSPWSKAEKDPFEFDWMVKKTAVKQLSKLIPKSAKALKFAQAVQLDNKAERPDLDKEASIDVFSPDEFEPTSD